MPCTVSSSSSAARLWPLRVACSAAYAGQSMMSPSSQGASSSSLVVGVAPVVGVAQAVGRGTPRPGRPLGRLREVGDGPSIGNASTSVGRSSPM